MIKTTKETYEYVFKRDGGKCKICGSQRELQLHHVLGRGRQYTNNTDYCVMLCVRCHEMVHRNNKYWRKTLLEALKKEGKR